MRHKDDACMDVAYCFIGEHYKIKIIKMKKIIERLPQGKFFQSLREGQ